MEPWVGRRRRVNASSLTAAAVVVLVLLVGPGLSASTPSAPQAAVAPSGAPISLLHDPTVALGSQPPPALTARTVASIDDCPSGSGSGRSCPPVEASPARAANSGTNSTPVGETGTELGALGVGHSPQGVAVDPVTNLVYVANDGGSVSILNGSSFVENVATGVTPYGAAFDPYDNLTYVTDASQNELIVFRGTSVVTTFGVQTNPLGLAVDPGTGYVYVANYGTNNLTVISGTTILWKVATGTNPYAVAYSSANGDVYVTDSGSNAVTVFNTTSSGPTRVATISVGAAPYGIAYDPVNQYLYVADNGANATSIIYGTSVIYTAGVGTAPDQVAADPINGDAYITNEASGENNVTVLSGIKVVGQVSTGDSPRGLALDPNNGVIYVANFDDNTVSQISTELEETAPEIIDHGVSVQTTDVGQSLSLIAQVLAPGSTGLAVSDHIHPTPGLGCAPSANLTADPPGDVVTLACSPTAVGIYSVYLNVTDSQRSKVWGFVVVAVDSALVIPPPSIVAYQVLGVATADVNQSVTLRAQPSGGSGIYTSFNWTGLGGAVCSALATSHPSCRFPASGGYEIQVTVVDSNFGVNESTPTPLSVYPDPVSVLPMANHSSADVTEPVTFSEAAYGGPGPFQYQWVGLEAANCVNPASASPSCTFSVTGTVNVSVIATDPTGARSVSPTLPFTIYSLPTVADPNATRLIADVGESIHFSTSATGGVGGYTYSWSGLPADCHNAATADPTCTAIAPGYLYVLPSVVDGNGGTANATTELQILVNDDPTVAAPTLSASSVAVGQGGLTISSDPVGGSGGFTYNWTGLPPGCSGHGQELHCTPSASGTYPVEVTVRDSTGFVVTSGSANLTVTPSSPLASLVSPLGLVGLGIAGALVALAVGLLLLRRRRRSAPRRSVPAPYRSPSLPIEEAPEASALFEPGADGAEGEAIGPDAGDFDELGAPGPDAPQE
jgi:YVTN family beta-propeller protein